jgi:MraZ protein
MFLGEFQHAIDAKGRVAIPARFRSQFGRGAVLIRGIEPCLYVFPLATWEAKAQALDAAAMDPARRRRIERRFFGTACECELDAQGRIVIPLAFRQYAGLDGETTIVGARQRIEIWHTAAWQQHLAELEGEDLAGLDLPF